ncbi:MAG: hypothetical protein ABI651_18680 [Verrucomicrobiota bacterium]
MKVTIHTLSRKVEICRFVDLPKLFDLLILARIFFPTIATLAKGDPFECGFLINERLGNRERQDLEDLAMGLLRQLPCELKSGDRDSDYQRYKELVQSASIDELREHVLEMEAIKDKRRVVCSCWHLGGPESDAMWKLYGNRFGIGLTSTVGRLASCLKGKYSSIICSPNPQEYTIAPVKYVDPKHVGNLNDLYVEHPYLLKREAFLHEQEVRIFHRLAEMVSGDDGIDIEVNPATLLKEIILSPFNEPWINDSLFRAIQQVSEARGLAIPVRPSRHMKQPKQSSIILNNLRLDRLPASLRGRPRRTHSQLSVPTQSKK